jgi:hypothetical protein
LLDKPDCGKDCGHFGAYDAYDDMVIGDSTKKTSSIFMKSQFCHLCISAAFSFKGGACAVSKRVLTKKSVLPLLGIGPRINTGC